MGLGTIDDDRVKPGSAPASALPAVLSLWHLTLLKKKKNEEVKKIAPQAPPEVDP